MPGPSRKVYAASARAHTRKNARAGSSFLSGGTIQNFSIILFVGLIAWSYHLIQPPPAKICGSKDGPPVTASRIKLKDGRHLAYLENGVPKEKAKYKIVFIHGFDCCRYDVFPVSLALIEELGIYILSFDRAGYGQSDPNPKMTDKSIALDIEELADQLELGPKFYVIGFSMGGEFTWITLKYIPHRLLRRCERIRQQSHLTLEEFFRRASVFHSMLEGAAIVAPVSNYWWRGFPSNLSKEAYNLQFLQDKWAVGVAHYAPWLTYWWNTQKLFPGSSVISKRADGLSSADLKIFPKLASREQYAAQVRQQGEYLSLHRDMIIGFGNWEFSPLELDNPFPNNEGFVHLWHGTEDTVVPVSLSRYIGLKLSWIQYHEVPDAGHLFPLADGMSDVIVEALLLGKK